MKKLLLLLLFCSLTTVANAQLVSGTTWNPFTGELDRIEEASALQVGGGLEYVGDKLTLTDDCADNEVLSWDTATTTWVCSVAGAGSTDDDVTVNSTAVDTTANFLDGEIDFAVADGGAGGPDDITADLDATSISAKADTTIATGDFVLFWDATDSALKKVDADELTAGGAETNSLETLTTGIADAEILLGDGVNSAIFTAIQACAADEKLEYTAGSPDTITCEAIGSLVDADISDTLTASDLVSASAVVDSVEIVTGSIDLLHMSSQSVDSDNIVEATIIEADMNADEVPVDNDILTFDTTGANFSWQTPAELSLQPLDTELTLISGLAETTGNVMIGVTGAWASVAAPIIDCTNCTNIPTGSSHTGTVTWGGTGILESGIAFQFGDATDATLTHTYGNTGTDVSIAYSTAAMAVTGSLTATNLSGSNTGDNTVATTGDSATAFFSSGEIADAQVSDTLTASDLVSVSAVVDSVEIVTGAIDLAHMSSVSVDSDNIVEGTILVGDMAVNSIDSDQYVDASIDTAHIALLNITEDLLAASLTFDATDFVSFGGIDASTTTEGLVLPQIGSACAAATAEGQICWDSVGDDLYVGDSTGVVQVNAGGAETNDLEAVATNAATNEVFVGTGAGTGAYIGIAACAGDEKIEYTDSAPNTFTCEAISGLIDADIAADLTINSTAQITTTAGVDIGTSQALVGTTAMTIGAGTQTIAVNSSDWDISATGVITNAAMTVAQLSDVNAGSDLTADLEEEVTAGSLADNTIDSDDFVHEDWGEVTNATGLVVVDSTHSGSAHHTIVSNHVTNDANDVMAGVLTADGLTLGDDENVTLGTASDWTINFDDSVDDQLLFLTANTLSIAATDPMVQFLVGTTPTADQDVFGVAKGTQVTNTDLFVVDEDGDVEVLGTITLTTSADSAVNFNNSVAADPCGTGTAALDTGALYYSSGGFFCYCDSTATSVDLLVSSNAACTY